MTDLDRQRLNALRHAFLRLHKVLLDWERAAYERIHGRTSAGAMLDVVLHDDQFAWLRPMSDLIVRIDEALDGRDAPDAPLDIGPLLDRARELAAPDEQGSAYAQRYHAALQDHPEAVLAHKELAGLL